MSPPQFGSDFGRHAAEPACFPPPPRRGNPPAPRPEWLLGGVARAMAAIHPRGGARPRVGKTRVFWRGWPAQRSHPGRADDPAGPGPARSLDSARRPAGTGKPPDASWRPGRRRSRRCPVSSTSAAGVRRRPPGLPEDVGLLDGLGIRDARGCGRPALEGCSRATPGSAGGCRRRRLWPVWARSGAGPAAWCGDRGGARLGRRNDPLCWCGPIRARGWRPVAGDPIARTVTPELNRPLLPARPRPWWRFAVRRTGPTASRVPAWLDGPRPPAPGAKGPPAWLRAELKTVRWRRPRIPPRPHGKAGSSGRHAVTRAKERKSAWWWRPGIAGGSENGGCGAAAKSPSVVAGRAAGPPATGRRCRRRPRTAVRGGNSPIRRRCWRWEHLAFTNRPSNGKIGNPVNVWSRGAGPLSAAALMTADRWRTVVRPNPRQVPPRLPRAFPQNRPFLPNGRLATECRGRGPTPATRKWQGIGSLRSRTPPPQRPNSRNNFACKAKIGIRDVAGRFGCRNVPRPMDYTGTREGPSGKAARPAVDGVRRGRAGMAGSPRAWDAGACIERGPRRPVVWATRCHDWAAPVDRALDERIAAIPRLRLSDRPSANAIR